MRKLLTKILAITAVLLGCFSGTTAFSQSYTLNGSATDYGNGIVRLTSAALPNQTATAWSTTKHDLTQPFDMTFDMFFGCENGLNGGDGMTFTFQNMGATAMGGDGGNLAIFGVMPSISIEFDTYYYAGGNDIPEDHIAINRNGNVLHSGGNNPLFTGTGGTLVSNQAIYNGRDLEDCAQNANSYYTIRVVWDPATTTLQLYEEGVLTLTYSEDIVNTIFGGTSTVFWGFTAATATAANEQWIAPAGSIIPWECSVATSCCLPYTLAQSGPTAVCNTPITIGVNNTYTSYKWSTGATTSTIEVSTPGEYSLTVLDEFGCPAIDTFPIAPTGPTATMTGDATICSDGTTSDVNVALTGAAPYKFVYSIDGVRQDTVTTSTSPYTILGTAPNVYTLNAVVDGSGCNGQTSGTATVSAYAALPIGHDTTFNSPGTAQLNVTDNGGTYEWYDAATGGTLVSTGASYTTPTLSDTTTYYVEDTSIPAFVNKSVGLLNINDPVAGGTNTDVQALPSDVTYMKFKPNTNFKLDSITCYIEVYAPWVNTSVRLQIFTTSNNTLVYTKDSALTTALPAGRQYFPLNLDFDCIAGTEYEIRYGGLDYAVIRGLILNQLISGHGSPYVLDQDSEVDIYRSSAPPGGYSGLFDWKISVGSPAALCGRTPVTAYPIVPPPVATEPLFIPNLMTPNKDGKNDVFEIKGLPDNSKLQIFNRWGDKIYANESYNNTWAADNQSDGLYFFDLLLEEGTAYKGWVQIVR